MEGSEETAQKAKDIGRTLRALIEQRRMSRAELGQKMGITENAVTQMLLGKSTQTYARLARLAEILETDPNTILGVGPETSAMFEAVIAGTAQGFGYSPEEASEIASIALGVLDRPPAGANQVQRAQDLAEFLIRQFAESKR